MTVGLWVAKRIETAAVAPHIVAQILGASIGGALLLAIASGKPGFDAVASGFATNGYGDRSPGGYSLVAVLLTEVVLTAGGTESANLGVKGMYWARQRAGSGPVILVAEGEHHATIEAAEWLRDAQGARLRWLPIASIAMYMSRRLPAMVMPSTG